MDFAIFVDGDGARFFARRIELITIIDKLSRSKVFFMIHFQTHCTAYASRSRYAQEKVKRSARYN